MRGFLRSITGFAALMLSVLIAAAPAQAAGSDTRPPQGVALARISVVRVLTYYYGTLDNTAPIPFLTPCASNGVIVGTTGSGQNTASYVLVASSAVSPVQPCAGVRASFDSLHGNASKWGITNIQVLLNSSYTGSSDTQIGKISYSVDPSLITTIGGSSSPRLLAAPLQPGTNAPKHELPVVRQPHSGDAAAPDASAWAIDLSNQPAAPLGGDTVSPLTINTSLFPAPLPVKQLSLTAPQSPNGGTATSPFAPSSGALKADIGSPIVDSRGLLVGMVVSDFNGGVTTATANDISSALQGIKDTAPQISTTWATGINAFYAAKPDYSGAQHAFDQLAQAYPDFGGVAPFQKAAANKSGDIIEQTPTAPSASSGGGSAATTTDATPWVLIIAIVAGIALALAVIVVVLISRQRRGAQDRPASFGLDDDPNLRLLPPNQPLPPLRDLQPPSSLPPVTPASYAPPAPSIADAMGFEGIPTEIMPTAPYQPRHVVTLTPSVAALTDPGVSRAGEPNQDSALAIIGTRMAGTRLQPWGLFLVADGMGGHQHGLEASNVAIEIVTRAVLPTISSNQPLDEGIPAALLRAGMTQAHAELKQRNAATQSDMGTTMTAALVLDDVAHIANVGDSRTYLLSPERGLRQVTTDHSVVANLVAAGVIRREDIYSHPRRNQIFRSLGGETETLEVDVFTESLQAGDKLLLCSDGVWEMVHDPQIDGILRASADPQTAAQLLVREANANGGHDNISVVVVRMVEASPETLQPGMRAIAMPPGFSQQALAHP